MRLQTPLAQALGRGAAKTGADHWWAQRVSAVAMVPLALWFFYSVSGLNITDQEVVTGWFSEVTHAALTLLLILNLCYHSFLGIQVVIEDYVSGPIKVPGLIASQFVHAILGAIGLLAIVKMVIGGDT
jgi:succinate dehydrogenase / fumarate reductase membrane anchor subunit